MGIEQESFQRLEKAQYKTPENHQVADGTKVGDAS